MRSAVLKKYRSALLVESQQSKELQSNQVRIKTAYAGVSFTDVIIQKGLYKYQRENMQLPYTPGFEASGTIIEVGSMVNGFAVGDTIVVLQRAGCLSSEIVAPVANVIKVPCNTNLAWAASLPVNFFTATHALSNIVKLFPNSDVLIGSAAGGVGGMLVQLASGDHNVIGLVGSADKKDYVYALGARKVMTYQEFFSQDQAAHVMFISSGDRTKQYYKRLTTNGKMVIYGFHSMVPQSVWDIPKAFFTYCNLSKFLPFSLVYTNKTVSGFNLINLETSSVEFEFCKNELLALLDAGTMPSQHNVRVYGLDDINQALEDLKTAATVGKIVVKCH